MSPDRVQDRLRGVLREQLGASSRTERISDQTPLYGKGLGLDSVDVVSLITAIESAFDIFFDAAEIGPSVKTFGSLLGVVRMKLDLHDKSPHNTGSA